MVLVTKERSSPWEIGLFNREANTNKRRFGFYTFYS